MSYIALANIDSGTGNAATSRLLVYSVMAICIAYDILAVSFGWKTISAVLRETDFQTGTLLRWAMVAVWAHLFVPWGASGYSVP